MIDPHQFSALGNDLWNATKNDWLMVHVASLTEPTVDVFQLLRDDSERTMELSVSGEFEDFDAAVRRKFNL